MPVFLIVMLKVNDPGVDGPLLVMVVISILKGESTVQKVVE